MGTDETLDGRSIPMTKSTGLGGLASRLLGRTPEAEGDFPVKKGEAEWREELTPDQFYVLRKHGTEAPGSSPLNKEHRRGTFTCAGCGSPLFPAETKFESGTGWPSFWEPLEGAVETTEDRAFFMVRTEVHCANCGGHLGHVFEDGPAPTGLRYCMNGVAMEFDPKE
jgi:peptide-methionine (R)-S-oxide reductase